MIIDGHAILSAAAATCGMGLAIGEMRAIAKARRSSSWPSVDALIAAAQPYSAPHVPELKGTVSSPGIRCSYTVRGKHYESEVWFGGQEHFWVDQESVAARYAMGEAVRVYYDPDNPSEAVLRPGPSRDSWWLLGFGVLLVLLAPVLGYAF
ncbi:MAG: DUF3592 domain-containing protein [Terriglobales bacterium]